MGLWEKPRARYAEEVTTAINRAAAEATRRRHREVTTAHLLWALVACPSVEGCLTTMSVDPAAARKALASELDALAHAGWMTFRRPRRNFDDLLVIALRLEADRVGHTLTAPVLMGRLASGDAGAARCAGLAKVGFARTDFLRVVAHGDVAPAPAPAPPDGFVTVVLIDDPFTTMEHVVGTLREVFGITTDAEQLMMRVHRTGRSVVATMDASDAQQKIAAVHARAAAAGMPLRAIAAIGAVAAVAAIGAVADHVASAPVGVSAVE